MHSQKHSLFRSRIDILILLVGLFWVLPAVAGYRSMVVNATAYNSLPSQTQGNPGQAAWNDKLHPGMHVIAGPSTSDGRNGASGGMTKKPGIDRQRGWLDLNLGSLSA